MQCYIEQLVVGGCSLVAASLAHLLLFDRRVESSNLMQPLVPLSSDMTDPMTFKDAMAKALFHALNANSDEVGAIDLKTMAGRAKLSLLLADYFDALNNTFSLRSGRRLYDRLRDVLIRNKW